MDIKFYCFNCSEELKRDNYVKSAPRNNILISDTIEEIYIQCNECGNVMLATFSKTICDVVATPILESNNTHKMIDEAIGLFAENNHHIKKYHFNTPIQEYLDKITKDIATVTKTKKSVLALLEDAIDTIKEI